MPALRPIDRFVAGLTPGACSVLASLGAATGVFTLEARGARAPAAEFPAGLELVVAAAPPLVTHPLMVTFDDRGRLFVGDAAGLNLRRKELEEQLPNRVLMLEDRDGDGVFEKSTVFADKMTFPQGAAWLDGSLYVASPPGIWKLTDTTGDGIADQREMIVGGFEFDGNAAGDLGRDMGPDLSRIGQIRSARDLLESILFPSATIARDYETHLVETADGQTHLGMVRKDSPDGLGLIDLTGQEKTIPHSHVVAKSLMTTSLMPNGLEQTLTEQQLLDLVAWLVSLR